MKVDAASLASTSHDRAVSDESLPFSCLQLADQ